MFLRLSRKVINKMDRIVCTLPAKPSSKKNDIRFKISPTIVEIIGKGLDCKV